MDSGITTYFRESRALINAVIKNEAYLESVEAAALAIAQCFYRGNALFLAGNGGSAADAQHIAAELVGRFEKERKGFRAIALSTDTSILTAWSNDYSFETIFSRQVQALARRGDVLLVLSTSGNSANIIRAVTEARVCGIITIALLGNEGGAIKDLVDHSVIVPSKRTPHIQEIQQITYHAICQYVENSSLLR